MVKRLAWESYIKAPRFTGSVLLYLVLIKNQISVGVIPIAWSWFRVVVSRFFCLVLILRLLHFFFGSFCVSGFSLNFLLHHNGNVRFCFF